MPTNGAKGLDPITVKILWDRLASIASEATTTQYRTAFSTVVRESNDFACSIMDVGGGTLAQSDIGLPSFVATQAITLENMLKRFPLDSLEEGDVLITNDPWIATAQIYDFTCLKPIVKNGRVVAFAGSVAHTPDIGGVQRWSLSLDVFEEGLFVPPMKVFRAGERNEDLFTLIEYNCRTPGYTLGDLDAQFSALHIMEQRVLALLDEQELDDLDKLVPEIYGRSEAAIRAVIDEIPDGTYTYELWIDNGFTDPLAPRHIKDRPPLLIHAAVTIAGSDITVDYSESSPQIAGGFNSGWTFTQAYTGYGVRLMTVPYLPHNAGFLRPLKVISKPGTIMNAEYPSAGLYRHAIGHQACDAVFGALAEVIPDRVWAQGGSAPVWIFIALGKDRRGNAYNRLLPINGGLGAMPAKDGEIATFPANLSNTPIEIMEDSMPIVMESKEVIPDSAGPGKYRGAPGQRVTFRAKASIVFSFMVARMQHPPQGLLGGLSGRGGRVWMNGEEMGPRDGQLQDGDVLVFETPGGGGMHPPFERNIAAVEEDVQEEIVSIEQARLAYGVVIDPQTLQADLDATERLRVRADGSAGTERELAAAAVD